MLRIFVAIFFVAFFSINAFSQSKKEIWSKAKIHFNAGHSMRELAALGVETDHGQLKYGKWFISAFSASELRKIRAAGFQTEILVQNMTEDFLKRNASVKESKAILQDYSDPVCNGVGKYKVPANWKYGSMGGHLTYGEMLQHLDSMRIKFPGLISMRLPLDTSITEDDSTVYFVRITDNPGLVEPEEPQGLFTAVHHAREPVGMHQLIFFMWYLLENYSSNGEIKTLLNNSDLYFVPCLNPDGYAYNFQNEPNGGGMWRKNRRDNKDGTFGVDLNRNYGHRWGNDDFGSSPNTVDATYRGTVGFSEPETKGMKSFCESHNFKVALNYHTYSNLLIHPWGYDGTVACEDSAIFRSLSKEFIKENNYRIGTGIEVLNYNSNGCSDDYMYATNAAKPKILAMTPEVGEEFWPTQDEILPLCLKNVHQNLSAVRALHPMISIMDTTGVFFHPGYTVTIGPSRILYKVSRIGWNAQPVNFDVTFKPFGNGTDGLLPVTKSYSNLSPGQTVIDSIMIPNDDLAMLNPDRVSWEVSINNQVFTSVDTIFHFGGNPYSDDLLRDNCDNPGNWQGAWVISADGPQEGSGYLKTSEGNYAPGTRNSIRRVKPFDLRSSNIRSAEMSFWTKFRVEKNYDMASLSLSTDSGATWINICTDKTKPSSPFSAQAGYDTIIPVWDGNQDSWRKEIIDLHDFLGNRIWVRFNFRSDDFTEDWGFGVDNIRIRIANVITSVKDNVSNSGLVLQIVPNPGTSKADFKLIGSEGKSAQLQIFDAAGKVVLKTNLNEGSNAISANSLAPGCYFVEAIDASGGIARSRWLVQ